MGHSKYKRVAEGIYRHKQTGHLVERVRIDGVDTYMKLHATTLEEARKLRTHRQAKHGQAQEGMPGVESPYRKAATNGSATMGELLDAYLEAGCPNKKRIHAVGRSLEIQHANVAQLRAWDGWEKQQVEQIRLATLDNYETWRRKTSKRLRNGRMVDMEIMTLRKVLHWGTRRERIKVNPLAQVEVGRYQSGGVCNCRDKRPETTEELHALGRQIFSEGSRSEVLGFQMFVEALTGLRTSEALALRWDAKPGEAGFIDGNYLHLARKKKGVNPWAFIHPALRDLLEVLRQWHSDRHPDSPWFFPSPCDRTKTVDTTSLVHALQKAAKKVCPGKSRTSHGLRAFYVTVRRSEFIPDAVIAAEIGDKSGATIIETVYGGLPPNWRDTNVGKLTWLPLSRNEKGEPIKDKDGNFVFGEPAWAAFRSKPAP